MVNWASEILPATTWQAWRRYKLCIAWERSIFESTSHCFLFEKMLFYVPHLKVKIIRASSCSPSLDCESKCSWMHCYSLSAASLAFVSFYKNTKAHITCYNSARTSSPTSAFCREQRFDCYLNWCSDWQECFTSKMEWHEFWACYLHEHFLSISWASWALFAL